MYDRKLWYRRPAESWTESLPIGNGRLGAMVSGGVNEDVLYLNEESIWSGHPGECERAGAYEAMKKLQKTIFKGDNEKAEKIVLEEILPEKRWFGSYQTLGELRIRSLSPVDYDTYRRELDLDQAIIRAVYGKEQKHGSACWKKEYLATAVHQVLAFRYTKNEKAPDLNLDISLHRERDAEITIENRDTLFMKGQCDGNGVRFVCRVKVLIHGGSMEPRYVRMLHGASLRIEGAESVEIYVAARTDYRCGIYKEKCLEEVSKAAECGFEEVKKAHIKEYKGFYDRFDLQLSDTQEDPEADCPTLERLEKLRAGGKDVKFQELFFHYQRYLLISSSRPGCLPSNLQGIWNYQYYAPWESDYHVNINLQINYWPAEAEQLSDCVEPLLDYMRLLEENGRKTARDYYHAGGFVVHHASNLFGHTAPCAAEAGMWPMGGAWMVRHLFEHYLYTGDLDYLEQEGYPIMKQAARFILDFLVEVPEGREWAGYLVTNPSHSPENRALMPDGKASYFTYGATMDLEIIRDLFENCMEAADILRKRKGNPDFEKEFTEKLEETSKKIPPVRISPKTGGIMEWIEDYDEVEIGHRHVSHLYALYPARQISPVKTPELAEGAVKSLERRLNNDYHGQGWSYGWIGALWARLGESEKAYDILQRILKEKACFNLFIDAHGNPQVGDAQGFPAAVMEMLVQYEDGKLKLLPALPEAWSAGSVRGLCTVGGCRLTMAWKNGNITELEVDRSKAFMNLVILCKKNGHWERWKD